jgi:hypothetical protein
MSEFKFEPHKGVGKVLFIVFIVLKLTGLIDWSWWWVTAPLWIPLGAIVALIAIAGIIVSFVAVFAKATGRDFELKD